MDTILRSIEGDMKLLKDAVNTMLISNNIEYCIPVSHQESAVFSISREYQREHIGDLKQQKDYNNRKKGTENTK